MKHLSFDRFLNRQQVLGDGSEDLQCLSTGSFTVFRLVSSERLSDQGAGMTENKRTRLVSRAGCAGLRWLCVIVSLASVVSAATQREVAEWAIRQGGRVTLNGGMKVIDDVLQLPSGPVEILTLDLTGTIIDPGDLKIVSGATSLRALFLPGASWTPGSDSPLDANDQLKYLAHL
jgi:hypothetical protein